MDTPVPARNGDQGNIGRSRGGSSFGSERRAEIKKKLMMMEAAMPAVLAWNMFQLCQAEGISPAAAARKIFQTDLQESCELEDSLDESSLALLQKLEDLIHYQRKLRIEFEKAEELAEFRDRQLRRKVVDLEMRTARNRRLFDEMIADLKVHSVLDVARNTSLESISSHDLVAFEEMQRLAENELILRRKIDELEKKERIYLKTLEQADDLWTALKTKT